MKLISLVLGIPLALASLGANVLAASPSGGEVRNGGDAIVVGGAARVFDTVEYDESFLPSEQTAAWNLLSGKLTVLSRKLPQTAAYLTRMLSSGSMLWWFVNVKLKDIHDDGPTGVIVTVDKEQVAANANGVVQIRKDLWLRMNDVSQAVLLLHEALWTAIGPQFLGDGRAIRKISTLIVSQPLDSMSPADIGRFMKDFMGPAARGSRLYQRIDLDLASLSQGRNFTVAEVSNSPTQDVVATVTAPGPIQGLSFTTLNPNPQARFLYRPQGRPYSIQVDTGREPPEYFAVGARELCDTLSYGGASGWRLPTQADLYELFRLGVMRLEYLSLVTEFKDPFGVATLTTSSFFLPTPAVHEDDPGLKLLTAEAQILNMSNNARSVSTAYGYGQYFNYICVKNN